MTANIPALIKQAGAVCIFIGLVLFLKEAVDRSLQSSIESGVSTLDLAKQYIPVNLDVIYKALNDGDPMRARRVIAGQFFVNRDKLDYICKPHTLRAHYVEAIIERQGGWFEVRMRVLFQPLEERAYVLRFRSEQDQFILVDVSGPDDAWFGAEEEAAKELARNFVYAAQAHNSKKLSLLLVPSIPPDPFVTEPCWRQFFFNTKDPRVRRAKLTSYKGLKMGVEVYLSPAIGFGYSAIGSSYFLVDRVNGEYKIVSADPRGDYNMLYLPQSECPDKSILHKHEDPNLEGETLKRFGLRKKN